MIYLLLSCYLFTTDCFKEVPTDTQRCGDNQNPYVTFEDNRSLFGTCCINIAAHLAKHCCIRKVRKLAEAYLVNKYINQFGNLPTPTRGSKGLSIGELRRSFDSPNQPEREPWENISPRAPNSAYSTPTT